MTNSIYTMVSSYNYVYSLYLLGEKKITNKIYEEGDINKQKYVCYRCNKMNSNNIEFMIEEIKYLKITFYVTVNVFTLLLETI